MQPYLDIDISTQRLSLFQGDACIKRYVISTAKNGAGEKNGSGCTPKGWHSIRIKIGTDAPINSVFVGRRATGEIYNGKLAEQFPNRDWILSRILWLSGSDSGINRGSGCDSLARFIYIHGTPDTEPMGIPLSHGCVRMVNHDMLELFDLVEAGMKVFLHE